MYSVFASQFYFALWHCPNDQNDQNKDRGTYNYKKIRSIYFDMLQIKHFDLTFLWQFSQNPLYLHVVNENLNKAEFSL